MTDDNIIPFPDNSDDDGYGPDEPWQTARVVRARITLEGYYNPDDPYDEDHLRLFIAVSCKSDVFNGDFAVKPEWVELIEDD